MTAARDDSAPEHRVGEVLAERWRVDRLLGVGGVASGYAAMDTTSGARVAVRVFHPELLADDAVRARFLREARVAGSIAHPAIVRVLADGATRDGATFVVTDFLDGETIDRRIARKGGKLPVREALYVADAVLGALAEAHAVGVVHRDVRVENVLLTTEHAVKLLDFGVAGVRRAAEARVAAEIASAPGDVDAIEDDLWAVGAAIFAMIAGEPPLAGQLRHELARAPEPIAPPPLATVAPGIPGAVAALVDRALALDDDAGWTDARAMQRSLRDAIDVIEERASHGPRVSPFSAPMRAAPRPPITAEPLPLDERASVKIPKASSVPSEMRAMVRRAEARTAGGVVNEGTMPVKWAVVIVVCAVVLGGVAAVLVGR